DLNNSRIDHSFTNPGDTWYFMIIPNDGEGEGIIVQSDNVLIKNTPEIKDYDYDIPEFSNLSKEGIYDLWVNTTISNNYIQDVQFIFNTSVQLDQEIKDLVDNLTSELLNIYPASDNISEIWTESGVNIFQLIPNDNIKDYMDKTITVQVKVFFIINDIEIFRYQFFDIVIKDEVPPRVKEVSIDWDPDNPNLIVFTADIEEFGSNIENVTLFYSIIPKTSDNNLRMKYLQNTFDNSIVMTKVDSKYVAQIEYEITGDIDIIYKIVVFDGAGNWNGDGNPSKPLMDLGNPNVPGGGLEPILYQPPGIPFEIVIGVVSIIIVIAVIFTYIGIRRFRKTEIVGLDIDKVMEETKLISSNDVDQNLSVHTLGIVISTFHQSLGPTPIFVNPNILMDNMDKLVDLSDRSFSAVRFVDDFIIEIQTNFNFSLSSSIRLTSMSYGFSLNRPNSRGGQENITLNILVHKPLDVILTHFLEVINPFISEIHSIMDKTPERKEEIELRTINLRKFLTRIILSYQKIYGDETFEEI
ncbi:MAG: hypothetical protein ACXACX_13025, partial [Candidatus Hodarchaeales archaeon]